MARSILWKEAEKTELSNDKLISYYLRQLIPMMAKLLNIPTSLFGPHKFKLTRLKSEVGT